MTREKALPALDAAHIRPFSEAPENYVQNGMLLRSDVHRLFDAGYVTVTPDYRFEVSQAHPLRLRRRRELLQAAREGLYGCLRAPTISRNGSAWSGTTRIGSGDESA